MAWNYYFYRCGLISSSKIKNPKISNTLHQAIVNKFGGIDDFLAIVRHKENIQPESGWVWISLKNKEIVVIATASADAPQIYGMKRLWVLNVWEPSLHHKKCMQTISTMSFTKK